MAKKTKAQKTQAAQEALTNALSDNKLTKYEIKAIKNADGGDAFKQYSTSLLDKIKAGDADTLKLLGASDLDFGTSIFNNKALKGTDYYQFGADILNKAAKDKAIDFNYSPERNKLAATLYQAAGDEKLVDPRWLAEANGQNTYKDKDGNYKLTSVGEGAFDTGRNSAEDLDAYRKQFYADNFTNKFLNPDGSLTADGQQAFNDFWDQSGISNRAKALEAFQQQVNPLYQSPNGTTPTNSDVNLPTGVGDMNEWAANNLVGTTTAPLSQQNIDALKKQEGVANENIAAGDRNAGIRSWLMDYAQNGNTPNNPYLSSSVDPGEFSNADASVSGGAQIDPRSFANANASLSSASQSGGAQIDPRAFASGTAGIANATASGNATLDPNSLANMTAQNANIAQATAAQLDPSQLRMMNAASMTPTTISASSNPYLGQTVSPITNDYIGKTVADVAFSDKNKYLGMNNPYLQSVIDYATGDVARNFNNNVQNSTDAMMARSGAFGGSAWAAAQAENNRQYANELGRTVGNIRMTDYQNQQQLEEADLNRRMQVALQNQQMQAADLARNSQLQQQLAQFNAGLSQNDIARNAGIYGSYDTFNANAANAAAALNANLAQDANRINASAYNNALNQNLGNQQQTNLSNAGLAQNVYLQDANLGTNASQQNASWYNNALNSNVNNLLNNNQFNAGQANNLANANAGRSTDVSQNNAAAWNSLLTNNANLLQNNSQFNANANNASGENNANRLTNTSTNNASAWNSLLNSNANLAQNNNQFNAGALNANSQFNANNLNAFNNANANRNQTNNQFNSTIGYNYWNADNNNRLNAANSATGLGDSRYFDLTALNSVGDAYRSYAQSLIGENQNNWTNKNNWAQTQNNNLGNAVNAAGGLNNTSTGNTTAPANTNPWGTIGGMASIAGGLLGSWGNQPSGGGGSGSINPNNTSIFNATNSWLPNYGWK